MLTYDKSSTHKGQIKHTFSYFNSVSEHNVIIYCNIKGGVLMSTGHTGMLTKKAFLSMEDASLN